MHIPNCGISCPLEKLYQIYDAIIPGQFEEECRLSILTMTYEDAEISGSMGKSFNFLVSSDFFLEEEAKEEEENIADSYVGMRWRSWNGKNFSW